jgi:DNA-binding beta-propeller fold protein YncE
VGSSDGKSSVDRPRAGGASGRGRRRIASAPGRALAFGGLVLAATLLWCAPALALSQRGHVFSFAFGTKGSAAGQLSGPSGVAVNESSGDVYVVDSANNRVDRFTSSGAFVSAWGWGVSDGKAEFEVCTTTCQAGIAGTGEGQLDVPEETEAQQRLALGIAVDNSSGSPSAGDVYVVSGTAPANNVVEKFSATGAFLGRLTTPAAATVAGVGVDASGTVFVYDEQGTIYTFNSATTNVFGTQIEVGVECTVAGFAVDAAGTSFYVNHQLEGFEGCPEGVPSTKNPAVFAKLNAQGEPVLEALDGENSSAAAVDQSSGQQASGDVYVDNITTIAAFDSTGKLIQRFGAEAELVKGRGVAVNARTNTVYVAASAKNRIDVFVPAPPGPPEVDGVSSQNLTPTSARLEAEIDPHGADTHFFFQYGTVNCAESPSSCTDVPAAPGTDLGSEFGDHHVSVEVQGLQSGVTYFFRVIAESELGKAEREQTVNTFTTLPNPQGLLPDGRAWELVSPPNKGGASIEAIGGTGGPGGGIMESSLDGNAVTYVADAPVEPEPQGGRSPEGTQVLSTRGSEAWSSKDIVTPHLKGEGFPAGKPQEYQAFSTDLSFALVLPWGLPGTKLQRPPLAGTAEEERGLYRRSNFTCSTTPASCYQPLVTPENDLTHAQFGGEIGDVGNDSIPMSTPDMKHVVFQSEVPLLPLKPEGPGLYEWSAEKPPAEQLKLVSVLPNGKPEASEDVRLGDFVPSGTVARNAISNDGSRVLWSNGEGTHLYLRDTAKEQTIQIDTPAEGVKKLNKEEQEQLEETHFQIANTEGNKIFFTDTIPLTTDSNLTPKFAGPSDLYECEVTENAGSLGCSLKDLTAVQEFGSTADVVGTVMGASEEGTAIYFAANGALAPGAIQGGCARPTSQATTRSAMCNLYVERFDATSKTWGAPRLIAVLSQEDAPDWGSSGVASLGGLTARVSPHGRYLAFMSNQPLTGYDSTDASPAAKGEKDEEVFLYDSTTQQLVCASCKPGSPPHGVQDKFVSGEGGGLLVDRPGVWRSEEGGNRERWLAGSIPGWTPVEPNTAPYQSRYLSDEGRLFFNGADALAAQDTNGKEDVYEFEPSSLGSCANPAGCVSLISSGIGTHESAFLDASASGNDVFFLTAVQLVPADFDNSFDVYDARVCTEASPCLQAKVVTRSTCETEPSASSCKAPESPQTGFGAPASSTFSGPTDVAKQQTLPNKTVVKPKPLTRAQKLAKALTQCRKKYKHAKKKRARCEHQARAKYGAKKATKHKHKRRKK